jgi:hypothetical protein
VVILGALIVAAAIAWAGIRIAEASRATAAGEVRDRALRVLAIFAPGVSAAEQDPRAILVWEPLARAARQISREEFALLDRATGATFPFTKGRLEAAHARWTADWLAWEQAHDAEYKLKAAAVAQEVASSGASALGRAKLDAIEREKLERYQRRYEEYVRVARGLRDIAEIVTCPT